MKHRDRFILFIVWVLVIFLLTGYPSIPMPRIEQFPADKIAHALMFFILGLIQRRLFSIRTYGGIGALIVLIAEFQQLFIPGRTFEIADIIAGLVGLAFPLILVRKGEKESPPEPDNARRVRNDLSKT